MAPSKCLPPMLVAHPAGAWAVDDYQASKTLVAQSLESVERFDDLAEAGEATALDDGAVTFPGDDSANSIIVGDIGVQMLTTIAGADAPTRYSYEVSLKPGQHLELTDSGAAVVNEDGTRGARCGAGMGEGRELEEHSDQLRGQRVDIDSGRRSRSTRGGRVSGCR